MSNRPDTRKLISILRDDLVLIDDQSCTTQRDFDFWLITNGLFEYKALQNDLYFITYLNEVRSIDGLSLTNLQWIIWENRSDLQCAFPLPTAGNHYINWFAEHAAKEYPSLQLLKTLKPSQLNPMISVASCRLGVNIVGHAKSQSGIGEDMRMAQLALSTVGIETSLLNFDPCNETPQEENALSHALERKGGFPINLFCMTAIENARYFATLGSEQFRDRYTIGYWPWELNQWPKQWQPIFDIVDEVWVSSWHTYSALANVCPVPVMHMPMAVDIGTQDLKTDRSSIRVKYGLPAKARIFCFSFDLNSSIHRKNPQASLKAFKAAFPLSCYLSDDIGLVIKVHRPAKPDCAWEELKEQARMDPRIHIIEETLSKPELLSLYNCCDCFVSLHRAEGFGRGIAEALQLGLHVITTGYSGNTDYCNAPYVDLVNYKLIPVEQGQYPLFEGQVWAEPDVNHAAYLMQQFYTSRQHKTIQTNWPEFSPRVVGERYRVRLEQIKSENPRLFTAM